VPVTARRRTLTGQKESPPDLPGGCTARVDPAEMVGGMHRRTDAGSLAGGTAGGKWRLREISRGAG
jgi:hypothetical protein